MARAVIDHLALAHWVSQARTTFPNDTLLGVFADWLEEQDPKSKWPNRIRKVVTEYRAAEVAASGLTWSEGGKAHTRAHDAYTALVKLTERHLPALLLRHPPRELPA